ncbi:para-nitrobenzyl esterase [Halorientalis persicus]|uniref:Para-nitrobenzyl esterase n=1 Tax=Halorientalis persicus TaxID=1367881 RepID=A0A1H8JVP1_9EURY|nr:carboxylesterase family protein [Halorientalis persicus]SEN84749.1 para-nitrobenzyl esterase [Halorientalis persicus]
MDRRTYLGALGGASVFGAGSGIGSANATWWFSDPEVEIESGTVEGDEEGDVNAFRGIPYAHQPVGERRFRPPETPAPSWDGTRGAHDYGPRAPQPILATGFLGLDVGKFVGSEDGCLNLNVWAPADADPGEKPVMYWIHGGAYNFGSNRFPGGALAEAGDVVVVAVNYRLNALGFFAHPEVTAASPSAPTNFGYLDIRAGLEWVQRNVAAFGGDPDNVTIFGESAGGHAVLTLLTDPEAKGLFHRAISQSGPINDPLYPLAELEDRGTEAARELDCASGDTLACLRDAKPAELAEAYGVAGALASEATDGGTPRVELPGLIFGVDGEVVRAHPATLIEDGEFHDVPVLLGGNAEEYQFFLEFADDTVPESEAAYRDRLQRVYGDFGDRVVDAYPVSDYDSIEAAYIDVNTDDFFLCSDVAVTDAITRQGGTAYRYLFDDTPTIPVTLLSDDPGAYHTAELAYVFGETVTQQGLPTGIIGPGDWVLRDRMQGYWTNFAASGDPNGDGLPEWREATRNQRRVRLQEDSVTVETGTSDGCAVMQDIYSYLRSTGR